MRRILTVAAALALLAVTASAIGLGPASASECVDSDGDGWGWDGTASSLVSDTPATTPSTAAPATAPPRVAVLEELIYFEDGGWHNVYNAYSGQLECGHWTRCTVPAGIHIVESLDTGLTTQVTTDPQAFITVDQVTIGGTEHTVFHSKHGSVIYTDNEPLSEGRSTAAFKDGGSKTVWTNYNPNRYDSPCLLYTSPSPRDATLSRMPSSA